MTKRGRRGKRGDEQGILGKWKVKRGLYVAIPLVVIALLALGARLLAQRRPITTPPTATPTTPSPTAPTATPMTVRGSDDVRRIAPAQAKALLDEGKAAFYDARSPKSYSDRHAAGAISFPEEKVNDRFDELPTDKALIFYCT